ncbi:hypothetical protein FGG08_005679 [Glutinoglossum americanum]|uniref:NACHT domain-containing protein n=1 Tax=Glutinoglossum americanum TaxID=1670608 RepID=A0A9P8HXR0_9PEZI|nr:hypothetical protein FGG08_005679 [Glutinoglossum americanum]
MGDTLGISASITAILQLTRTVVHYLHEVKGASEDRQRILVEVASVSGILFNLKDLAERKQLEDSWSVMIKSLNIPNGPIEQFKLALQRLASNLAPVDGLKKFGKALVWPFQKGEIEGILGTIERQKALFNLALQNDHIGLSQAIKADIASLHDELGKVGKTVTQLRIGQAHQESRLQDQEIRDILAWLSPLDFPVQQSDFIARRQEGTGQWLLECDEFKTWLSGTRETLFCPGIPGAGKTMLASIAIDYLWNTMRRERIGIAYIYFNYRSHLEQTPINLLASLLKQLLQEDPFISDDLKSLYERHVRKKTRPTFDEVYKLLHSEMNRYTQIFIVVDALDEFTDNDGGRQLLLSKLRMLQATSAMNLMATLRFIPNIVQEFQEEFKRNTQLEIRASDGDVVKYVEARIGKGGRLRRHVEEDPILHDKIVATVVKNSQGMFLLAQLHMDSLAKKHHRKAVRLALDNLPKELDSTYAEALQRIECQDEEDAALAHQVLSWISFAIRPLTVQEIKCALAVEPGQTSIDNDTLIDEDLLVSVCAGMVTVDQESGIIRLVHYTTQEYFERIRSERFPDAQQNIAATCLVYLSFDIFEGYCSSDKMLEDRLRQNVLLDYAARNWGHHASGDAEQAVKGLALEFLKNYRKVSCSVQVLLVPNYRYIRYSQRPPKYVSGIHLCAYFGLKGIIISLLESTMVVGSKDSANRTPLSWAAERGHEEVVKLLLSRGDVAADSKDEDGRTPLSWAAEGGHQEVVKLLLARDDVAADSKDKYPGRTPLSWAAERGHEEVVKLLLGRGDVTVDSKDWYGRTPLLLAAAEGHEGLVKLLLVRDDVAADSKTDYGQTPLLRAAGRGHAGVVKLLLDRDDVAVDSKDRGNRTPLSWAAWRGHEETVKLLLGRGAAADSKDLNGRMPLSWAAARGHLGVVNLLTPLTTLAPES